MFLIKIVYEFLKDIREYENNPRFNDEAVDKVINSIKEFGFKVPIIVDKSKTIIAGHTRYKASKKLGLEKVPVIIADDLTEEQVKAFRLADNIRYVQFLDNDKFCATFRKGVWTMQKFNSAKMLHELLSKYFDEVKVIDNNYTQLFAICKKPKRFTEAEYKKALDIEFNMEYPNGYKHNKHEMIVGSILKELRNG